jgi:hypothetical protein
MTIADEHAVINVYGDLDFSNIKLDELGLSEKQLEEIRNDEANHEGYYIQLIATSIQSFTIHQDRLKDANNDDEMEKLLNYSTKFCERTYAMGKMQEDRGLAAVQEWLAKQNPQFIDHANAYQELYQKISHLAEKPYFVAGWTMAFMVDIALEVEGVKNPFDYNSLTNKRLGFLDFAMTYSEHLLTCFFEQSQFKG